MEHPFLAEDFEIAWSTLVPQAVEPDITRALEEAGHKVDEIANREDKGTETLDYEDTFGALETALEPLNEAWGKVAHLDSVCNSGELRKAYNAMLPKVSDFFSGIPLNEKLWATLKKFAGSPQVETLNPTRKRHVEETVADFRDQGADLPAGKKEAVRRIQQRLAEVTQKFSENVLDATNAWEKLVTDEALLAGLPESALAAARENARRKGHESAWRFTLQAPSLIPVLTYADNEELRKEAWQAFNALGSQEPFDNRECVREILELRQSLAELIGKNNFADLVLERRMAASGSAALKFTEDMHSRIAAKFGEEVSQLQAYKAGETGGKPGPLEPWEAAYWAEKQRRARYDFDEEELRPYFPIGRVISGMFEIAQRVFKLRISERGATYIEPGSTGTGTGGLSEVWHPEVKYYDLFDEKSGTRLGSFFADWHPRESKRGGAWMNHLITGSAGSPHLGLICGNLTPSIGDTPALLTHREVETIFHEFGHLLHHLCGNVEVKSLNGTNVAWDFVELPSQIMENWCWERGSLDLFARHHETGEAIPAELFDKMIAARNYMSASATMRQLAFGKMDLELHVNWAGSGESIDAFVEQKLSGYRPEFRTRPLPNTYQFTHLFASPTGYGAGYYSYKWSEVLDADAFTRFQQEGIFNPETGLDFRSKILARGNSVPPAELFRDFMGRDPDPEALLQRAGLA